MSGLEFMGSLWLLLVVCVLRDSHSQPIVAMDDNPLLIRPLNVYQSMIKGVHDYFNNTCIILFHGSMNVIETKELEDIEGLLGLQKFLSGALNIRTAIMDFITFRDKVGSTYYNIKRPLFVLLNDLDEVKEQFVLVSQWIAMAYPTWLIFLRNDIEIEDFLGEVYVPFDCVLMVAQANPEGGGEIVREVYRIGREDHLRWMDFGTWNSTHGFKGPLVGLYQRRHDLKGRNLRVVSIHDPPVSRFVKNEVNHTVGMAGFFGEVIQLLQEGMNCTACNSDATKTYHRCRFSYQEANSWGVRLPNGTWTGSMGMLMEDEADLAATELMMTSDRLDIVKFTTPVYSSKCRVYIKRPDTTTVKWNAYLAPFALNVWNAIALTIFITGISIATIDAIFTKGVDSDVVEYRSSSSTISEIVFFVFGAFCGQGMEPSPLDPIRMVHLSIHATAVVVLAAYSAALISFLAIKTFAMPFTTMAGMLEDGSYRFAVVADSADYSFFQNTSDRVLTFMFEQLLTGESDLPSNYLDGLSRVCQENKYAFMTLDNMAAVLQGRVDCILEPLDVIAQTTIAMAVPANSPYRGIIDAKILLLRDSGILQRLLEIEWATVSSRPTAGWSSVELEDAMPLLIFLLIAFIITWVLLLVERSIHEKHDRSNAIDSTNPICKDKENSHPNKKFRMKNKR
ncbi:probable glutamate receptor isoform X1 [Hylaeus anthracinus]|uniref:probable glutamate receptor isoform X1 n=1 Tax=Hylaeus anthracinus TaxID=313031 RepID=UPI0023B89320|nr:probable glutamate receptor isoform X1 [Hylaeus anthracinus]